MLFRRIEILRWEIVFLFNYDEYNQGSVVRQLIYCGAPESIIRRVSRKIEEGNLDEGFTYPNFDRRVAVVGIGHTSTRPEFLSSFCHELRHLVNAIASDVGFPIRGEKAAYLAGEIARRVADVVCHYGCPHCGLPER